MIDTGGYLFCETAASPVREIPFPRPGRARLGVMGWRMLEEFQAPLHRRAAMSPAWRKALQPFYFIPNHEAGQPPYRVRGNQAAVLEAFEQIRKAAGDFDQGDLDVN